MPIYSALDNASCLLYASERRMPVAVIRPLYLFGESQKIKCPALSNIFLVNPRVGRRSAWKAEREGWAFYYW